MERQLGATYQDPIHSARPATALSVAKGSNAGVETQAVGEDVLDMVGANRLEFRVVCAFGDDDDRLALPNVSMLHLCMGTYMRMKYGRDVRSGSSCTSRRPSGRRPGGSPE